MDSKWQVEIDGKPKLWNFNLRELWQFRSLIWMLYKRNYSVQYKQTVLGPFWMIFGVVFNTGIFTLVFGYVGNMDSDGIPYFLFCLSGNIIWTLFASCFLGNTRVLMENAYLFGKVYFPRLAVPVANGLLNMMKCLIQLVVCAGVWAYYLIRGDVVFTGLPLLGMIPLLLLSSFMGTSLGMIISSLTVKYRDLGHVAGIGVQGLMYVSPVLYPVSQLSPILKRIVYLNPMSAFVEAFRYCLTGTGNIYWPGMVYGVVFSIVITMIGLILFGKTEKNFVDIV
ncbi:MAG: ABC transporter permease [Lachnospiraceae bacterium]|nr:ABC transporter permease [Lachnospiraceae bacterium]